MQIAVQKYFKEFFLFYLIGRLLEGMVWAFITNMIKTLPTSSYSCPP